jgi:hypothetical protein
MPINPNIALGVQQQQPVNMLGQMGQMMALKAASQEMQSNEDMRNLFAGGANFDDPDFQKRGYMASPKAFQELLGKRATTQKTELEVIANDIKLRRDAIGDIKTPEDYLKWHDGNHVGRTGAYFKSIGVNPSRESIIAQLNQPGGLEKLKRASALGATDLQKELMQTERTRISAGASYGQLELSKQEAARKQQELDLVRSIINDNGRTPAAPPATSNVPMGGGGGRLGSGTFNFPMGGSGGVAQTPPTSVVTQPNTLAMQAAPLVTTPAPVNGLLNPPVGQTGVAPAANRIDEITQQLTRLAKVGGSVAGSAMENLIKEYNVLNPEGEIKQNASGALVTVNRRTNVATPVLGKDGKPVMGSLPYETAFGSKVGAGQGERNEKVVLAAQAAVDNIAKIDSAIELLKKGDATTGLGAELRTNIDRAKALFAGDIKAGKRVADTQILDALLGSDVFSMIQSLGIGAKGLDTPAERDYLRQVMTGTIQMDNKALIRLSEIRRNIETRAIEKYNTQLEKGELNKYFETQGVKPEKIEIPKVAVPQEAIDMLKNNPALKADFDAKYGTGASKRYLGQ